MKLNGKVAIVTASGRGIGRGIVLCLAEEGADVVVNAFHEETTNKVVSEVKAMGRQSQGIPGYITKPEMITKVIQDTLNAFSKIDILVNNVGGIGKTLLARTSLDFVDQKDAEWDENYELNLKTQVLMCRAVAPYFIKQKSGKIVNIASIAGKVNRSQHMAYSAAKAGAIHFTRILASALAEHNINVNCICPGVIYTPLWEVFGAQFTQLLPEAKGMTPREYFDNFLVPRVPLKRGQTVEDIGHAVVFLVSEDAKNITGQSLNVDGGMIMN